MEEGEKQSGLKNTDAQEELSQATGRLDEANQLKQGKRNETDRSRLFE